MTRLKSRYNSSSLSCMTPRIAARVLAATLAGAALFASAPALADYDACMTFCLDEHNFSYCHPICDGSANNAEIAGDTSDTGGTESAVPVHTAKSCDTFEEIDTAFWTWITENYEIVSAGTIPLDDNLTDFETTFPIYGNDDVCTAYFRVDDACQLFVIGDVECSTHY